MGSGEPSTGLTGACDEYPWAKYSDPWCPAGPWTKQVETPAAASLQLDALRRRPGDKTHPEISIFQSFTEMQEHIQRISSMLRWETLPSAGRTGSSTVGGRAASERPGRSECIRSRNVSGDDASDTGVKVTEAASEVSGRGIGAIGEWEWQALQRGQTPGKR